MSGYVSTKNKAYIVRIKQCVCLPYNVFSVKKKKFEGNWFDYYDLCMLPTFQNKFKLFSKNQSAHYK